jgi:hypothetical protein
MIADMEALVHRCGREPARDGEEESKEVGWSEQPKDEKVKGSVERDKGLNRESVVDRNVIQ